jgi:hypothetical protein
VQSKSIFFTFQNPERNRALKNGVVAGAKGSDPSSPQLISG